MKKLVVLAAMLVGMTLAVTPSAQDKKITELSALTTPTTDDLLVVVDAPGGTPATMKATIANFFTARSLADLGTRSAGDLNSGTLADARLSSKVPLDDVAEDITGVWDFDNGIKERNRSTKVGEWIDVAYDAANFTASSGTWTVDSGDQGVFMYALLGKTMFLTFQISSTDVSATPSSLRIAIPGGFVSNGLARGAILVSDAGTFQFGLASVSVGSTFVTIFKDAPGNTWTTTSADNTNVAGQFFFRIQ